MNSPLMGKVLIAAKQLIDPNFVHSVVLIVQHDDGGAMGVVINRPLDTQVKTVWPQVSEIPYPREDPLFRGGPCDGPLMVLHGDAEQSQVEVMPGLHLSTDADKVRSLVSSATSEMKFFVGYAGWSSKQLEGELLDGAWLVSEVTFAQAIGNGDGLWEALMQQFTRSRIAGVNPRLIPPDPSVN